MTEIRMKLIAIIIFSLIVFDMFFIQTSLLRVVHYEVENRDLRGLKVLFAGDFHFQKKDNGRLERVAALIEKQDADLVLLAGDFINGFKSPNTLPIKEIAKRFGRIKSKHGTFTVLGNHENFAGSAYFKNALERNNIKVLENKNVLINDNGRKLYIVGLSDAYSSRPDVDAGFQGAGENAIVITHSPDVFPDIPKSAGLVLAGHTHGGQIALPLIGPLYVPSDFGGKYAQGFVEENGKKMIVTSGVGTSTIHARFGTVPEIIVIEFK